MAEKRSCEICKQSAEYIRRGVPHWSTIVRCPRCGEFEFDRSKGLPGIRSRDDMVCLSGWVRDQNAAGVVPQMTREAWDRAVHLRLPGLRERANRALGVIAR